MRILLDLSGHDPVNRHFWLRVLLLVVTFLYPPLHAIYSQPLRGEVLSSPAISYANAYCSKEGGSIPLNEDEKLGFDMTLSACRRQCDNTAECEAFSFAQWNQGLPPPFGYRGKMRCQLYKKCVMQDLKGSTVHEKAPVPALRAAAFALQGRGFKVAILVRRREPPLRLEELRVVLLGTSRRPAMLAACHMPTGETIAVASCHLSPDFNVAERAAQILQLHGELKGCGCEAELIAGDTNMSELDKDAVASVKDGFVDCWRPRWTGAIGVDCAATFQGDGRTRPRAAGDPKAGSYERIDRFFVRGAIRCTGMEVTGRKPLAATTEGKVPDWWGNERSGRISDHLALRGMFAVGPSS